MSMQRVDDVSVKIGLANILICDHNDELGSVLIKTGLSHEPIYVYNKKEFMGLVSPYHTLFHNSYAYATKVIHCLITPPHIVSETSVYDIARYMIDLKLYSLPIFDDQNNLVRVITANNILNLILKDSQLIKNVCEHIQVNVPITSSTHSTIRDVYSLMREKRIGRVILLDKNRKLKGILSRKDLQNVFMKQAVKTQYISKKGKQSHSSFDEALIARHDNPALKFATTRVITSPQNESLESLLKKIIRLKLPSVVIVKNNIATGFISRFDILKAFVSLKPVFRVPIIWENSISNFRKLPMNNFYSDVDNFATGYNKQDPLHNMEIHISRPSKEAKLDKQNYSIKLHMHLKSGKTYLSTGQDPDIRMALKKAVNNIQHQSELSDRQKHDGTGR